MASSWSSWRPGYYQAAETVRQYRDLAPQAGFLLFTSNWEGPGAIDELLPRSRYAWGYAAVNGGFDDDTLLVNMRPDFRFGRMDGNPPEFIESITGLFGRAGLRPDFKDDIISWLWVHHATNAGLQSTAIYRGGMPELLGDPAMMVLIVYAGDCGGTQRVFTEEVYKELEMFADPNPDPSAYFPVLFPAEWMESHPDLWKDFADIKETSSPENIKKQSDAYVGWEGVYDQLPDIARPTLVATGTEDISTPPENAVILAARIPGSWLVRFEGAGHGLMYQYPDEFARVITDFIELSKEKETPARLVYINHCSN